MPTVLQAFFIAVFCLHGSLHHVAKGINDSSECHSDYPAGFAKNFDFGGDPLVTADTPYCILPFNRVGNLIVVQATIDSVTGNFILDTGAPGLILNLTYFRNYKAVHLSDGESGGITGTVDGGSMTEVARLRLGTMRYSRLEAGRANLGHLENSRGIKILGLLGMQLFRRFEMILDYENNLIHLRLIHKKEAKTYRHAMLEDTATYREMPIEIKDNKLYTFGEMGGKKLTFIIDTGAESNVLDSRLPDRVMEQVTINSRVVLSGTGSARIEALTGEMKSMQLPGLQVNNLPVLVTNLEKMCTAYDDRCLDGLLGFDFLSMHKIGFNFVTRKMYVWK